ncbi:MAG: PQQ-dependent catabolism-associated CXXCW motif protein [Rhodomicrobium sp.]
MRVARFALLLTVPFLLAAGVPELEGFRMDNYNAPVPETLAGARVVNAAALAVALKQGAIPIDVLPAQRRPPSMPAGQPWLPLPRMEVPGSLWWPEVGRGAISPALDTWFRGRLAAVTGGDTGKMLAFYCKAECWMSWNAAKRAAGYGYRQVLWFPGGAEAWAAEGFKLQPGTPEAVPLDP